MSLDVYDAIALTIRANNDEITNKRAVQKLVYFHTVTVPNLEISGYTHHLFGPFNYNVTIALEDMVEFSYIAQNMTSSYYEIFNYKLTDRGIRYAKAARLKYSKENETISKTIQICKESCELRPSPLSYAAKAHYILANSKDTIQDKYFPSDVMEIAKDFDWNVSEIDATTGLDLLQGLDLVSG